MFEALQDTPEALGTLRSHSEYSHAKEFFSALLDNVRLAAIAVKPTFTDETNNSSMRGNHTVTESQMELGRQPNGYTEFLRLHEDAKDKVYRVPRVLWNTPRLAKISFRRFGLLASFYHLEPPPSKYEGDFRSNGGYDLTSSDAASDQGLQLVPPKSAQSEPNVRESLKRRQPLKVAVEMSGHMRTFRQCRSTTVHRLLRPNNALLFVVTYPDIGDKRYGVREQLEDDPVPMEEIAESYGSHLAAAYHLDLPTVSTALYLRFPSLFVLKQWSWMIYQLFTMELTHNITLRHVSTVANIRSTQTTSLRDVVVGKRPGDFDGRRLASRWSDFDAVIRIRPDLYIVAAVRLYQITDNSLAVAMRCKNINYWDNFTSSMILRSPHHPTIQWYLDHLSDHSAIGTMESMTKLLTLYSAASVLEPKQQERLIFFFGQTAERLWNDHARRRSTQFFGTFGWHIMLRDSKKYKNTTFGMGNSERRKVLNDMVFGQTDGTRVECPHPNKTMRVMGEKPLTKKIKMARAQLKALKLAQREASAVKRPDEKPPSSARIPAQPTRSHQEKDFF